VPGFLEKAGYAREHAGGFGLVRCGHPMYFPMFISNSNRFRRTWRLSFCAKGRTTAPGEPSLRIAYPSKSRAPLRKS
jgi:hypothetical protein